MKKAKSVYGPKDRGYFKQKPQLYKAYSAKDYTLLPDPVRDSIVSNNISSAEFDYTYDRGKVL